MLISFIIPVYNVQQYLHHCIESILLQTIQDFEIILVNDGSTDRSGKICDQYAQKDQRITVVNQKNQGVSIARNKGLNIAKGKYIAFVDSDDYICQDYIARLIPYSEKSDIIFFGCTVFGDNYPSQNFLPNAVSYIDATAKEEQLFLLKVNALNFEFLGFTWSKIFKRELIEKNHIQFIPDLKLREDELFTLEVAKYALGISILDEALYHYRKNTNGLTQGRKSFSDYNIYAEHLYDVSQHFKNTLLVQELVEQALIHKYFAYTKADKKSKEKILDRIFVMKNKSHIPYIGRVKRAKLMFSLPERFSRLIIKSLSLIEKNKF